MEFITDISELTKNCIGIGGLLSLVCFSIGSVINILYHKVILKGS